MFFLQPWSCHLESDNPCETLIQVKHTPFDFLFLNFSNTQVNWLSFCSKNCSCIEDMFRARHPCSVLSVAGNNVQDNLLYKSYIRTKISFALLRSSVLCLRGYRATRRQQAIVESSISAIVHEGGLS